jgi:hypothetical protein
MTRTDCQKAHWQVHKEECAPLNTGRWQSIHRRKHKDDRKQGVLFNRRDQHLPKEAVPLANSLENLNRGDKPFIVKVQVTGTPLHPNSSMLIYDRKRELLWSLFTEPGFEYDDPGYPKIAKVVTDRGWRGMKAFMWAKKVSDDELSVCLDPLPNQSISW